MIQRVVNFVKKHAWARYVVVLLAGVAISAVFYPTKHIEERERQRYEAQVNVLREEHQRQQERMTEMYNEVSREYREFRVDSESKIAKLSVEIRDLKSKQKTSYYKIVRPDGTVEVRRFSESEVTESTKVIAQIQEEFKTKIESIEKKWSDVHRERVMELKKEYDSKLEEYQKKIVELEKDKIVDINKKSFGVEVGLVTGLNYYGHVTYDVFGPFFLGLHTQLGSSASAGAGIGIRF